MNKAPWERTEPRLEIIAVALLFPALSILPGILYHCGKGQIDMPGAVLSSCIIGLGCCLMLSPRNLGLLLPKWGDILTAFIAASILLLAVGGVTALWGKLLDLLNISYSSNQPIALLIKKYSGLKQMQILLCACVIIPLLEEVLFRRLVYGLLLRSGFITAVSVTTLIFSILHFFVLGVPGFILLGCGFQICFLCRKNLTAAVMTHMLINSVAVIKVLLT